MVAAQLQAVRARIAEAARRAGRPPETIRLICVTKTASPAQIREALAAGATDLGENRVQAARPRIAEIGRLPAGQAGPGDLRWHLIGALQRNKAKTALECFDWIQSVDRVELAEALERHAAAAGRTVPVLVEVNTSREPTKHGVAPEQVGPLLAALRPLAHLDVQGLMTMAPVVAQPEQARPYFRRLRELAAQFQLPELSMGMSHDFEVAVEEGATMVRIGTAIFG